MKTVGLMLLLVAAVASTTTPLADNSNIVRSKNGDCKLPKCRCWNDPMSPGNFSKEVTPQMITLTFSEAMNDHTVSEYLPLFDNLYNPNNCPAKGTFFTQDANTDDNSLKKIHSQGHEISLTTANSSVPRDSRGWAESFFKSFEKLLEADIPKSMTRGVMAPNLQMGGDEEMHAVRVMGLDYEASCVLPMYDQGKQMVWPYTYDCGNAPQCVLGKTPRVPFGHVWQFVMPELKFDGHTCTILSSCIPYLKNKADVFTFIYNSFIQHYHKSRAPLVLYIDPLWLAEGYRKDGLRLFLQTLSRYENTWLVSLKQALEWIKTPVRLDGDVIFKPWECDQNEKRR